MAMAFTIGRPALADLNDGLVAYYPFNGNANDESGKHNDGIVNGATLTEDRFNLVNRAYQFDGENDFIEVLHSDALNFGYEDFSYSFWINIANDIVIIGGEVVPLKKSHKRIGGYAMAIRGYTEGYGRPYAIVGFNKQLWTPDQDLRDNQWHMLTFVRKGDVGIIFVDGILNASDYGYASQPASIDRSLFIGEPSYPLGNGEFKGKLDDIKIYNRAISEDEIMELYNVVGFSEFTLTKAKLIFKEEPNMDEFEVKGEFTVGEDSDGIYPLEEDVKLTVGNFNLVIPSNSFELDKHGKFKFKGICNEVYVKDAKIEEKKDCASYKFEIKIEDADLPIITLNPLHIELFIGNDIGIKDLLEGNVDFK